MSMGANNPKGVASLDPRGLVGSTYVGDHYTLLHTKHISSGLHCFREEDFLKFFFDYMSMGANEPRGVANYDPSVMFGRIYVGDHLTSLYT